MALIALVQRHPRARRTTKLVLVALGIFGASLFYGDGMITPAISVLSAVEGLEVGVAGARVARRADHARDPHRAVRGPALRDRRRRPRVRPGDGACGSRSSRSPGSSHVLDDPGILRALSPTYAVEFLVRARPASRSSRSARSCSRSPAPRRCTPTWATSAAARSAARGSLVVFPALIAQLHGPGRADPRRPGARSTTRSSCCSRTGLRSRWWSSRRSPTSSPRRRSSRARSRSRARRCSSASCRG